MHQRNTNTKNYFNNARTTIGRLSAAVNSIKTGYNIEYKDGKPVTTFKNKIAGIDDTEAIALENKYKDPKMMKAKFDPVNMSTGCYIYDKSFLKAEGVKPLSFEIRYNSTDPKEHTLGRGWNHNQDIRLEESEDRIELMLRGERTEGSLKKGREIVNAVSSADRIGSTCRLGYIGYRADDISGTYFAQVREYMPEVGRFAGRDIVKGTILEPLTLNNYQYCHSNPIGFVDLNGMNEMTADKYMDGGLRGGAEGLGVEIAEMSGRTTGRFISRNTIIARKEFATEFVKRYENPSMGTRILTNIQKKISPKTGSYRTFVGKAGSVANMREED